MISIIKPFGIGKVADRFKDIFENSNLTYAHLCSLLTMYLYGLESISELLRVCSWAKSSSALSRAIHDFVVEEERLKTLESKSSKLVPLESLEINTPIVVNRFMRRLRASIKRKFKNIDEENFVYALDDTGNPKYGTSHPGTGVWANSSGGKYRGQKIMVLVLVNLNTKQAYPIAYSFLKKEDKFSGMPYETGHEVGIKLVREILNDAFSKLPLVADSWFSTNFMIEEIKKMEIVFVSELKSNRNLKDNISPNVKYKKADEIFKNEQKIKTTTKRKNKKKKEEDNTRYYSEKLLFLVGANKAYKVTAVFNKLEDKEPFAVYMSTDNKRSGEWIWSIARARWAIEVMFRDLKQNLSFGRMPSECKEGSDLSVCLPFVLYTVLCLEGGSFFGIKDFQSGTIGTLVKKIRDMNFDKSLKVLTSNPTHILVQILKNRRNLDLVNKKPVNKPSEQLVA